MNIIEIINLIKGILANPDKEWLIIRKFKYTWQQVYFYFTIPMVFLVALSGFFRQESHALYMGIAPNWIFVINFAGPLLGIIVGAWLISRLAPRFNSLVSFDRTVSLISFAYTPSFLANIISSLHVSLGFINLVGIIYMVFLFWKGTALLLDTPAHKLTGFVIINLIILFAVRVLITSFLLATVLSFTVGLDRIPGV